ncbi:MULTISPECIES: transporter substrate-binding domain-containing protein [unclassified Pseudomonas]|uniref:transporter substrate-binding domain-containing protein n=1 Tax=unclassified Pseudomonas TaxID=196821 RepID=UPI0011A0BEA9|nr:MULTISPECIES: transporter substrate-binding domain-containing protein [unclassified Pseudomonas]TWC18830.1 two-component system sensor histidine kinase EvgS [Pseudomonas sp. SJZ083]TWC46086.1 two-component system sensor histidine kinase EvgS [Pseudomonas sp. SJZ077]
MNSLLLNCLFSVLLLGQLGGISTAQAEVQSLNLFGRSNGENYAVVLDETDWRWLRNKNSLSLGVSAPDYVPFDIITNGQDYEGITADYAALLATLLHIKIEVRRYDSRAEVIQALKRGELDLVGTANSFDAADPALALSSAYAQAPSALVTRRGPGQVLKPDLADSRLAMLDHFQPMDAVSGAYPKAQLQLYPSARNAIGAVAFGQADAYVGDLISTHYLVNKHFLNDVRLTTLPGVYATQFSFAVHPGNLRLLHIVNAALAVIPITDRMTILRRWSAGDMSITGLNPLQFSAAEQRWLEKHPRLTVAVNDSFAPISFFDGQGEFRGIGAEVLAKVSQRTGLKFNVLRASSTDDMIKLIKKGNADLIAAFNPSTERASELRLTRPYLTNPFVLVTRDESGSPERLEDMAGKKLALRRGNALHDFIRQQYPGIQLIQTPASADAMALVAKGEADGAINALINGHYLIMRDYRDRLRMASIVGLLSAQIGFATDRGALELYSILDKALQSIPPEELDELTSRWHHDVVIDNVNWRHNRTAIIQGFVLFALLLLVAVGWIIYLRQLMSKHEKAELALNDQMEFMRVLIDGTPHPIYVRDRQGRLVSCNTAYLDVVGVSRETVMGKQITDSVLLSHADAQIYHDEYMQVMEEGTRWIQDRAITRKDGSVHTVYHWMLPYRTSDGVVTGIIAGWIDISERQLLFDQLQNAKKSADDANRAKTTFLATMSHEIRTPLNAVIGMLELAMMKADQGVMDRFAIEVASGAARGLLELIGDILDIARIESGRLSLSPERANLRELVESVVRMFEGAARQKGLRLSLDFDLKACCDVLIDPLRFKQILSNLLSNAIKFTDEGEVGLSVKAAPSVCGERLAIHVQVKDTGIGISAKDQEQLFSPFGQASNHHQSARGSSGLGLVICRTLCEMMQGQLHLTAVLGKGTQIDIHLNLLILEPLPAAELPTAEPVSQAGMLNILVIDDYPANRLLLSQQLSYLGHGVSDAEDGAHGLRAWRNGHFDVVITDCNMPVMNGYELTRAIRDEEKASGTKPCLILGFTANAQPDEKDRCLAEGMDDCLFKPISLGDLSARLASVQPGTGSRPAGGRVYEIEGDIDLSSLQQLTHGDHSAIDRLLGDLAASNEEDMLRLIKLFSAHDLSGLSSLAHRVKGGARIVKACSLIQCCEQLEDACLGADSANLTEAVDALLQAMERLAQTLERRLVDPAL